MSKKPKKLLETKFDCPYCKKAILLRQFEETIEPSIKAKKKTWTEATKDTQKKLDTGDKKT